MRLFYFLILQNVFYCFFPCEIFGGERSELPFLLFKLVCPVCFKCWKVSCTALQWLLANGQWAGGISNLKRLRMTPRSVLLCWSCAFDDIRNLKCFDANDFTCAAASARHLQKGPPHPRSLLDLLAEKNWLVGSLDSGLWVLRVFPPLATSLTSSLERHVSVFMYRHSGSSLKGILCAADMHRAFPTH